MTERRRSGLLAAQAELQFLSYLGESEKADGAYGGPRQRWESQKLGLGMETKTRELLARLRVVSLKH